MRTCLDRGFPVDRNTSKLCGVVTYYMTCTKITDAVGVLIDERQATKERVDYWREWVAYV